MIRIARFAAAALLAGCASWAPPGPEVLARVRELPAPHGPCVRARARLRLESPRMSGVFEGAIVLRTGPEPAARAQFFPDLGGKALDLAARPDRITAVFPQTGERVDTGRDGWRPHFATLLGISLLEIAAPVEPARVTGARTGPEGLWVELRPVTEAARSYALIDPEGAVTRRRFRWSPGLSWDVEVEPGRRAAVKAPGLEVLVEILRLETLPAVPDATFTLDPQRPPR